MADPLVARGLTAGFGRTPVLAGIDLDVGPSEIVAVLGGSGSGKTTLLRCLAGLHLPSGGSIAIGGTSVVDSGREHVPAERRGIGVVFQEYALFPALSVADNVGFGLQSVDSDRVSHLLAMVGCDTLATRRPSELSGGQQQRIALARALAPRPSLLLLDEPFANVDAHCRTEIATALEAQIRASETAALMVTHDRDVALRIADRLVVLTEGTEGAIVAQTGRPWEVHEAPVSFEVAGLTGDADLLPGGGEGEAQTPLGRFACSREGSHVITRPHWLEFEPRDAGLVDVRRARFSPSGWEITVGIDAHEVRVLSPGQIAPGTRGRLIARRPLPRVTP